MLLHGNLSLFFCQGAEIYSHSAFILFLGKFCPDSKQNSGSGGGVLKLTRVLAQAEKYDCNCGEWSERLIIQDPATAATEFCTGMARMSMKLWSESRAIPVKVGAGRRLWRSALIYFSTYFYCGTRPGSRFDDGFRWGGQIAWCTICLKGLSTG
jgi:hypothetical protein